MEDIFTYLHALNLQMVSILILTLKWPLVVVVTEAP